MRSQCAHWLRNDTVNKRCSVRADVGIGPYGSATRGAMGGRPQGSPLRRGYKGCGGENESPSHGFAVPAPFRQGGRGDGGTDCHDQFANWSRNDTVNKRCGASPGGRTEASAPTEVQQEVPWAGDRKGRPYESVTRGAVKRVVGGVRPYEFFAIQIFAIKKGCR